MEASGVLQGAHAMHGKREQRSATCAGSTARCRVVDCRCKFYCVTVALTVPGVDEVTKRKTIVHGRVRSIRVKMFMSIRAQGPADIPEPEIKTPNKTQHIAVCDCWSRKLEQK